MRESERVRNYELLFVVSPLHSGDEEIAALIERVQHIIEQHHGEVTSVNHDPPWGRRKLAYPIRAYAGGEASRRSFTEGFYVLLHFSLMSTRVIELERMLKLTDAVLRHLITIVEGKPMFGSLDDTEGESEGDEGDEDEGDEGEGDEDDEDEGDDVGDEDEGDDVGDEDEGDDVGESSESEQKD